MKKYILSSILLAVIIFLQACGAATADDKSLAAKQKELDKKIAQRDKLEQEIETLEKEIAKLDTTTKNELEKIVGVTPVTPQAFSSQVEVMGKIDVDANANLSATQGGTVTKIYVREGSYVKAGQTLAQLDNDVMSKNIVQARQAVAFTTDLYNKQKALWDQKIGSEVQYLNAKNNKENAEAQLNVLLRQNDMFRIKAIYPGVVDEVSIKLGQLVSPGMPAFRVVGTKGLKLNAEVPESYIAKVKQGNSVQIYLPDLKKEVTGKVNYLSRVVDPLNRTFTAEILLPDNNTDIKTNMVGILRIRDYNKAKAIVIPVKTLLKNSEGYYVFVAAGEGGKLKAEQRKVTTGAINGDKIEIVNGLNEGDQLVTTGFQSINHGDNLVISK